jgi:hypothetical protein
MQDSPSRTAAKPLVTLGGPNEPAARRERLRVLLLGANVWVLGVLWPLLGSRSTSPTELVAGLLCPLPLLLGGTSSAAGSSLFLRSSLWLVAYPAAFAVAVAVRPEGLNQHLYGPLGLVLLWLSLCAYGASAVTATAGRAPELAAVHTALGTEPGDTPQRRRTPLQLGVIGMFFAGAGALCLVAPQWGGQSLLEQAWGDAAQSGGVLTAVVGAALGVATLAIYLSAALRAKREPEPHSDAPLRVAWFLFLALLGIVTYFVIQP